MASRQEIGVVRPELRRRGYECNLAHPCNLGGDGRHQYRGRICGRAAGHAKADSVQRTVSLDEIPPRPFHPDILVQNRLLEGPDPLTDTAYRPQKLAVGLLMRRERSSMGTRSESLESRTPSIRAE